MTVKLKIIVLLIPINNDIELLQKKERKSFLPYCSKLYGAGREPGTFEFVTYLPNDLTNYTIDYL